MQPADPTIAEKTLFGGAWMAAVQVVRQLLQILSVSILAHRVPPIAYGIVAMAVVVLNLLETVRDLGTSNSLVREPDMTDSLASTAFWLNVTTGVLVALSLIAASRPAARFFREPLLITVLGVLSITVIMNAIAVVPTALMVRNMAFRSLALCQTVGAISGTAVAIGVAVEGGKLWSLLSGGLTTSIVTTFGIVLLAPFRARAIFRREDALRLLPFGLYLSGSHISNYVSRNLDNLIVGRFLGSTSLGYYQMGYVLMTYPLQNVSGVINQVMYPALSLLSDDMERTRVAYLRACALISLVSFPLMFGLAVTAHEFIWVFLGERWLPVAGLLVVFAPLGAAQSLHATVEMIYHIRSRTDMQFRWTTFTSCVYGVSFFVGLRWGIIGVASCYSLTWFLLMVPSFAIPFRLIDLRAKRFLGAIWPMLWMSLVMALLCYVWGASISSLGVRSAGLLLGTTIVFGAAVYLGLLLWRKPAVLSYLYQSLSTASNSNLRSIATFMNRSMASVDGVPTVISTGPNAD